MATQDVAFPSYRSLVQDWTAFQEAYQRPQPEFIRVNRIKSTVKLVKEYCESHRISIESSPCFETVFRWTDHERSASETILHWNGTYYIQDPVTVLPVRALKLKDGETVLDLCAAPGGKSLAMAERLGPNGAVIANDPHPSRRISLNSNIQRLGATNVLVTSYQGQSIPEDRQFSAILVDAPCSGEGAYRGTGQPPVRTPEDERNKLSRTQTMLLKKAYRLLKPGGRLIYATCSFAPEENERVIDDLKSNTSALVETIDLDGPHDAGVTSWEGNQYHSDVEQIWRVYPHHYDGGGLVFAKIRKPEGES